MAGKISPELLERLKEAAESEPEREIPVIVNLIPTGDLKELERKGLTIHSRFEYISAVAGTIPAARAEELAQLDQVKSVEFDGEVRAL
jgi:hypothetical protein